ncbi:putative aldo-keto reductase [Pleurotus ostreatus PC15]|uniref:Putative aldo-keto reductase n=1 Tax=Pleurotus ostreatus (strain PC15) TaxID=1137138 RepID=A0A067N826_PLEO1|nr:putative aldo-keto reductase [Pleurotus ostreatus PC15]
MPSIPIYTLNNGVKIPAIGLGGWTGLDPKEQEAARGWFLTGLQAGYRHVDVAHIYGTEESLGKAIKDSGLPREELFITTKLPWSHHSRVAQSFQDSLTSLGLDYVDLYLLHWPHRVAYEEGNYLPKGPDGSLRVVESPSMVEVWADIEKLLDTGKVRAIGVSNFSIKNLEILLKSAKVVPAVNQVEMHPYLAQPELLEYCKNKGILVAAYTPTGYQDVLTNPTIVELAGKYGVAPAQVVLAWHVARGVVAVPKSSNKERQKQNITLPTLEPSDIAKITALDRGERLCNKPDENGKVYGATMEVLGW